MCILYLLNDTYFSGVLRIYRTAGVNRELWIFMNCPFTDYPRHAKAHTVQIYTMYMSNLTY